MKLLTSLAGRKVRTQLMLGFAAVIALAVAVGLVAHREQIRTREIVELFFSREVEVGELVLRSQSQVSLARRFEKDFISQPKGFDVEEAKVRYGMLVRNQHEKIHINMAAIRRLSRSPAIVSRTTAIDAIVNQSEASFAKLVLLFEERLRLGSGIEPRLAEKRRELRSAAVLNGTGPVELDAEDLLVTESGYLLREGSGQVVEVARVISKLKRDAPDLAQAADEYADLFRQLVELNQATSEELERYLTLSHTLEPPLEALHRDAEAEQEATRREMEHSGDATSVLMLGTILVAAALGVLIAFFMSRWIARRINQFLEFAQRTGTGARGERLPDDGASEFDSLANGLNRMADQLEKTNVNLKNEVARRELAQIALRAANAELESRVAARTHEVTMKNEQLEAEVARRAQAQAALEEMHKELASVSRAAGMAEVATSVLHNVGNVLNSVNVSSGIVSDTVRRSKVVGLTKLSALLAQEDVASVLATHPKTQQVSGYLAQLGTALAADQTNIVKELESLQRNIEHIKVIVSRQQAHAKGSGGLMELLSLEALVQEALALRATSYAKHRLKVECHFEAMPLTMVDRHKVFQIVLNLLSNARHAVEGRDPGAGRIMVSVRRDGDDACLEVKDNGCGVPSENLSRIFNYGFTTKKQGHGFGLHSSACAAMEMGATLTCKSAGIDHGAAFMLRFPLQAVRAKA